MKFFCVFAVVSVNSHFFNGRIVTPYCCRLAMRDLASQELAVHDTLQEIFDRVNIYIDEACAVDTTFVDAI